MKISIKALVNSIAIMCGIIVFLCGIINMIWPTYATEFLQVLESIYPGYHSNGSFTSVILATLYSVVYGMICATLFGWIYNWFVDVEEKEDEEIEEAKKSSK